MEERERSRKQLQGKWFTVRKKRATINKTKRQASPINTDVMGRWLSEEIMEPTKDLY